MVYCHNLNKKKLPNICFSFLFNIFGVKVARSNAFYIKMIALKPLFCFNLYSSNQFLIACNFFAKKFRIVQHLLLPQFPFSQTKCQNNFHGLGTTLQMVGLPIKRVFLRK
jgi:hypothetical protein